jgi:Fic family protein
VIYATPTVTDADRVVLEQIEELRSKLRFFLREPRRWYGSLRRATLARAVQGSNSIEGYHASVEDVVAVIEGEEPLHADEETRRAIEGYRDAMTYVLQLGASPPMPALDESLVKSLHFMMLKYDLTKNPGQWRPGAVWVENFGGQPVYEAPPREELEGLVGELLDGINADTHPPVVRAAMAHLNLALIHPFSDGNGRMARCVQSWVLAGEGVLSPEFLSIEEYLGRNTAAYYEVLTDVAQGSWNPDRDARPWLRFCLTAHYRQARTLLRRIEETEALWDRCEQLARRHRLADRTVGPLCDAARGWQLRRSLYVKSVLSSAGEQITDATATRDLAALAKAGLLTPVGEKRGRSYQPTDELRASWRNIRASRPRRPTNDPYDLVQPELPGLIA